MEIFSEVAAGAQAIHDLGFSHRDIKPANIMFLPNGRPQLMDLGSCSLVNEHIESMKDAAMLADTASVKSTPTYRAPELFDCTHLIPLCVGPQPDIWSLGCVLYAMAFGRSPFEFGPHGSFERLAVMNASMHFEGHTPKGLECATWNTGDTDETSGQLKIVETHAFISLIRRMLDPNPRTRISLKDAVHMAIWKVGDPGSDIDCVSGNSSKQMVNTTASDDAALNEAAVQKEKPADATTKDEDLLNNEGAEEHGVWGIGEQAESHESNETNEIHNVDMGQFAVDWDGKTMEHQQSQQKSQGKEEEEKKVKSRKHHHNTPSVMRVSACCSDGVEHGEGINDAVDLETMDKSLSMDEDDEFGEFVTPVRGQNGAGICQIQDK